jgi:hypothetical protein
MNIEEYIVDYWHSQVSESHPVLTIYDSDGRYQQLLPLAEKKGFHVVDTTEKKMERFLEAREYWRTHILRNTGCHRLLLYRKRPVPVTKDDKIEDPYYALTLTGIVFPLGARDSYDNLCVQFMPNHKEDIEKLFENGHTSFEYINSLESGATFPVLEKITGGKSLIEMSIGFLQIKHVTAENWETEWKKFCALYFPLYNSTASDLKTMQKRLWQYLLFSEFVLDLPRKTKIPDELKSIPTAPREREHTINDICNKLRNDVALRDDYVQHAEEITKDLNLSHYFEKAKDLGKIVTFSFENIVEYLTYIDDLNKGFFDEATALLDKNLKSVWYSANKQVAIFWNLASDLNRLIHIANEGLGDHSTLNAMIKHYADIGYEIDQAFRSYKTKELSIDFESRFIKDMTQIATSTYQTITEQMVSEYQSVFADGINQIDIAHNISAFDDYVLPHLKEGKRVAMVMADAFRFEMGQQLARQIESNPDYKVECIPSMAQLPTYTQLGMAALLPSAENNLQLKTIDGKLLPLLENKVISVPKDRIGYIQKVLPYKVQDMLVTDFTPEKVEKSTKLLVLRSTEIDSLGEHANFQALDSMNTAIRNYARLLMKCQKAGIDQVYIFADHGYMLRPVAPTSDAISKPNGTIVLSLRRCLAGDLDTSTNTLEFTPQQIGVKADVPRFAFAKSFCIFTKGKNYFHEGLSLEENIVPIVSVGLLKEHAEMPYQLTLSYKNNTVRVLRPRIDFNLKFTDNILGEDLYLKLIVTDSGGKIVGHAVQSSFYDEVTEVMKIPQGSSQLRQTFEVEEGISGNITITALSAKTEATVATLELKTDLDF